MCRPADACANDTSTSNRRPAKEMASARGRVRAVAKILREVPHPWPARVCRSTVADAQKGSEVRVQRSVRKTV